MKKQSYMVAVKRTFTIEAVVYVEQPAENASQALALVKGDSRLQDVDDIFDDELKTAIEDREFIKVSKPKFISCGKASQYHSENECAICKSLKGGAE